MTPIAFFPCFCVLQLPLPIDGANRLDEPQATSDSPAVEAPPEPANDAVADSVAESPFSFNIGYSLYSDYVTRGVNFSEYRPEGREDLNHQLTWGLDTDVALLFGGESGRLGTFSYGMFFEWFAGQRKLDEEFGGQNAQEVDYNFSWAYDIESIQSTLTLGFGIFAFPNHKEANSAEWTVQLDHNDAWMWQWLWPDNEEGVLNPYILYVHDVDFAAGGKWMEVGVSHDFEVADNLVITPTFTVAGEHHYLSRSLGVPESGSGQLAYLQYGLNAGYDLSSALGWPKEAGSWVLSTFLYFNEVVGAVSESNTLNDELFGGLSIGWSF